MAKNEKKALNILFIGNSHTYFNDMPLMYSGVRKKTALTAALS